MSNMSYVRFQNTLKDLRDCHAHLLDELEDDELEARKRLVDLCRIIVEEYDDNYEADDDN